MSFEFGCRSFCSIKEITVNCTNVLLFFLNTFFKGKAKSGFYCVVSCGFLKKTGGFYWVVYFTTTLFKPQARFFGSDDLENNW